MAVMNVQSTNEGLDDLTYYIVPESWYRKAWCSLLKPGVNIPVDWREQVGALEAVQPWWDKSCGLDTSNMDWVGRPPSTKPTTAVHGDNYYFVGKNAWGVLENKFSKSGDSAHGVACRVVSWPLQDSRLAVQLPNGERIPIPGSGRFAYETSLEKADGAVRMDDESVRNHDCAEGLERESKNNGTRQSYFPINCLTLNFRSSECCQYRGRRR